MFAFISKSAFISISGVTPSESPENSGSDGRKIGDGYFQKFLPVFRSNVQLAFIMRDMIGNWLSTYWSVLLGTVPSDRLVTGDRSPVQWW